jgi:rod shape-determining protein MreD
MIADGVKAVLLLTLAATLQIAFVDSFELVDGRADIVLLVVVGIALLRGPVFGAAAGFYAGLVLDMGTLGTLGLSSLLLTIAGY